ncbi:MAG TPA: hypothetical protein VGM88_19400 [Kofleriaceae bacterium]
MKRAIAVAILAACGSGHEAAPAAGSGSVTPAPAPQATAAAPAPAPAPAPPPPAPIDAAPEVVVVVDAPVPIDAAVPAKGKGKDPRRAEMEREAAAFADAMGKESDARHDADVAVRRPGAMLDEQTLDAREGRKTVTPGDGSMRRTGMDQIGTGNGAGESTVSAAPAAGGTAKIADARTTEHTSLTAETVTAKIAAAYMAGIQRCYKIGLRKDATLRGHEQLSFRVEETGKITPLSASGVDATVDHCIFDLMSTWHFPIPKDAGGETDAAFFSVNLLLEPS